MDSDRLPENPQKEPPLPPPSPALPPSVENLQKHFQELQARFQTQATNAALAAADAQEQYLYLRKLLSGTLVALLLFLLAICLFIGKQMRSVRAQLQQQRPFILQSLTDFQRRVEPNLKSFANQLQTYAATHPEFRPILEAHRPPLAHYFTLLQPTLPALSNLPTNLPPAR